MANDLPTLVWAPNLADLELHTSLSRYPKVKSPTMVVFDLDPGPPADIIQCCQVGIWLKKILTEMGLERFPKTSGSKGLQIYAPLNTATNYENTKSFAKAVAKRLELGHPDLVVSRMAKILREGKVFVDWSQSDDHRTTACIYSLRAKEKPTVSTPVTWKEVEATLKKEDASKLVFTFDDNRPTMKKSSPSETSAAPKKTHQTSDWFHKFATKTSAIVGSPWSFVGAVSLILIWAVLGPAFHFADTWQLVINTATTIITFLMVFLIQNTQNRDAKAIHLKLDELIHGVKGARNQLIDLEDLSDEEMEKLQKEFTDARKRARIEKCEEKEEVEE